MSLSRRLYPMEGSGRDLLRLSCQARQIKSQEMGSDRGLMTWVALRTSEVLGATLMMMVQMGLKSIMSLMMKQRRKSTFTERGHLNCLKTGLYYQMVASSPPDPVVSGTPQASTRTLTSIKISHSTTSPNFTKHRGLKSLRYLKDSLRISMNSV